MLVCEVGVRGGTVKDDRDGQRWWWAVVGFGGGLVVVVDGWWWWWALGGEGSVKNENELSKHIFFWCGTEQRE